MNVRNLHAGTLETNRLERKMTSAIITRQSFLQDRQGRTFADVLNDPEQPFDDVLDFFNDEHRQRRMVESEIHHDRSPLAGVVRDLESQPSIDRFLASKHPRRTKRLRQAVGVVVRMIMERLGWKKTGKKGSLGVRAKFVPHTEVAGSAATAVAEPPRIPRDRRRVEGSGRTGPTADVTPR